MIMYDADDPYEKKDTSYKLVLWAFVALVLIILITILF